MKKNLKLTKLRLLLNNLEKCVDENLDKMEEMISMYDGNNDISDTEKKEFRKLIDSFEKELKDLSEKVGGMKRIWMKYRLSNIGIGVYAYQLGDWGETRMNSFKRNVNELSGKIFEKITTKSVNLIFEI